MNRTTATRALGAIAAMATLIIGGALPAGASSTSTPFSATYTSGPDTVTSLRCAPHGVAAVCHGKAFGVATYSGDWDGTSTYTYRYVVDPRGTYHVDVSEEFTGRVTGCGAGSFFVRTHETIDALGNATSTFTVIGNGGSGELAGMTAHGVGVATYLADGTGSGSITGTSRCRR